MSLRGYRAYKPSGVGSLGDLPEHWDCRAFKRVAGRFESGTSVNSVDEPAEGVAWGVLKTSCVYENRFTPGENKRILAEEYDRATCPLRAGALIVSRMNTSELVGAAGLVEVSNPHLFLPDRLWQISLTGVEPRFAYWWTQSASYRAQVEAACTGTSASMKNLSQEQLGSFMLPLPEEAEQHTIAAFLDRETAKIDALVAEQERLIELLKEKRQAVISHAVTKGLNPTAQTEPSGIGWLGDVPVGWARMPIKHCLDRLIDTEHKTAPFYEDGQYLVVRTTNVRNGRLVLDGARYTDIDGYREWSRRGTPEPGDIIFTREAPAGEACLVPEGIPLCLGQRTVLMKVDRARLDPRFALWSLYGGLASEFVEMLSQGSTVAHFNMSDIGNIPLMVPPLDEQVEIAEMLDRHTSRVDRFIAETERAISLAGERRAALISAAVTGQIDVRGIVNPEAA